MSKTCADLHKLFSKAKRFRFPFDEKKIPQNGIYILFEKGEKAHGGERIVRVGTHTGRDQLRSRLKQHFTNENKDRSIFRKNIGRALLSRDKDNFAKHWELDLTTREAKKKHGHRIDFEKQKEIEKKVTSHIQKNFSFVVFEVKNKNERLTLELKIISTINQCKDCRQSKTWLGNFSPKEKIRRSGLWLVNELFKTPLNSEDFQKLKVVVK